ncbi:MAG: O-antigen polysaccharide polymerase Wzy, partial [Caproiciproducens sp.]|nr:O-antigen polysaccharide polymerase Wzy [Caproiciproducens sp.]
MIKIKSLDFIRDTVLFGLTILVLLAANLLTVFGGDYWKTAVDVLLVGITLLNVSIFSSLIAHIRRDFALLVFVVAFNLLLLGRVYVNWIGYHHKFLLVLEAKDFPQLFQALQIVALSLLCVYLAYHLVG